MTNLENAERLREYYLTHEKRKATTNICNGKPKWNGCDFCDIYGGCGLECWKQDGKHNCIHCTEKKGA